MIAFEQTGDEYTGCSAGGRSWRIVPEQTGWRLSFRDAGDSTATNAGVHRTVQAAMAEADHQHGKH